MSMLQNESKMKTKSIQASHHILCFLLNEKPSAQLFKTIPKLTNVSLLCCHFGGRCVDDLLRATVGKLCLPFQALLDLLASGLLATRMPTRSAGLYSSDTTKAHFDRPEEAMSLANN